MYRGGGWIMADSIYIQSVSITPNPVTAGGKIKIEVEIYTLCPQTTLYPASTLYPGEDLFALHPDTDLYPSKDIYPTEGGIET